MGLIFFNILYLEFSVIQAQAYSICNTSSYLNYGKG